MYHKEHIDTNLPTKNLLKLFFSRVQEILMGIVVCMMILNSSLDSSLLKISTNKMTSNQSNTSSEEATAEIPQDKSELISPNQNFSLKHPDFTDQPTGGLFSQAIENWYNPQTGETVSFSSGGRSPKPGTGWVRQRK